MILWVNKRAFLWILRVTMSKYGVLVTIAGNGNMEDMPGSYKAAPGFLKRAFS